MNHRSPISSARIRRARKRAAADFALAGGTARDVIAGLRQRLPGARGGAHAPELPDVRPDGSYVSPPLPAQNHDSRRAQAMQWAGASAAPFARLGGAVRDRWREAVQEGKLAAKEKEDEIRGDYLRRVHRDGAAEPRLRGIPSANASAHGKHD